MFHQAGQQDYTSRTLEILTCGMQGESPSANIVTHSFTDEIASTQETRRRISVIMYRQPGDPPEWINEDPGSPNFLSILLEHWITESTRRKFRVIRHCRDTITGFSHQATAN